MSTRIRAFDFGGSGAKTALYEVSSSGARRVGEVALHGNPDYDDFANWLRNRVQVDEEALGISSAGFVDLETGINHKWSVAGLIEFPLAQEIKRAFPSARNVWCLNDAEAHLWSSFHDAKRPVLSIAIGTAVAIAVSDEQGRIIRTRPDRPLECGNIRLRTSATQDEVCWALGSPGLEELQEKKGKLEGAKWFGYRIGAFAAQYAALFQARTVVLSGGVAVYNWEAISSTVKAEFEQGVPHWMKDSPPTIILSKWGREAALAGSALYAYARMNGQRP